MGSRVTTSPIRNRSSSTAHPRSARSALNLHGADAPEAGLGDATWTRSDGQRVVALPRTTTRAPSSWPVPRPPVALSTTGRLRHIAVTRQISDESPLGSRPRSLNDTTLPDKRIVPDLLTANRSAATLVHAWILASTAAATRANGPVRTAPKSQCRQPVAPSLCRPGTGRQRPLGRPAEPRPDVGPEVEHGDRRQGICSGSVTDRSPPRLDRPLELRVGADQAHPPHPRPVDRPAW